MPTPLTGTGLKLQKALELLQDSSNSYDSGCLIIKELLDEHCGLKGGLKNYYSEDYILGIKRNLVIELDKEFEYTAEIDSKRRFEVVERVFKEAIIKPPEAI